MCPTEDAGASPTALDAEDADLASLPPEEAARKLASQNRLLRGKLRAAFRAEEENAKLRAQVENLAQQLVRRQLRARSRFTAKSL